MNSGIGYILAGMFLFYIWVVQPQLELASLPEVEKVRIFEQKKHDAETQALFDKQQEQKIDALLKKNFSEVSQEDIPAWLYGSLLRSNSVKVAVFILVFVFGGLCIVRRI